MPFLSPVTEIGFAAAIRTYYPVGDRRRSHFEAALFSWDGRQRGTLSRNEVVDGPAWVDGNRLVWVERRKGKNELFLAALPSRRRKLIATALSIEVWGGGNVRIGAKEFRLMGSRLRQVPISPKEPGTFPEEARFDAKSGTVTWRKKQFRVDDPNLVWKVSYGGEGKQPFRLRDYFDGPAKSVMVDGVPLLRFGCLLTAHEELTILMRLDLKAGTAHALPLDAAGIWFDARRHRLVARSERCMRSLGDLGVWTNELYVGAIPSLRFQKVGLKLSQIGSVGLRP